MTGWGRRDASPDKNQAMLVAYLSQHGVTVETRLADCGGGVPDLLLGYCGVDRLAEVKNPERRGKQRNLRQSQQAWADRWAGSTPYLLRTTDDCDSAMADMRRLSAQRQNTKR